MSDFSKAIVVEKLDQLEECLAGIDSSLFASNFQQMFSISKILQLETDLLEIVQELTADQLNYLITHFQLSLLFYKVKDHRWVGSMNRTSLIRLFCEERLADLSVVSKMLVIDALQMLRISAHDKCEDWVKHLILSTHGDDLSELKCLMDAKVDIHSFHKLVYIDITSEEVRGEILRHIKKEAKIQQSHFKIRTKHTVAKMKRRAWRKVISDVDDTLLCSGNLYPAGIDNRYPRKCEYPGVFSFYKELDVGLTDRDDFEGIVDLETDCGELESKSSDKDLLVDISTTPNMSSRKKSGMVKRRKLSDFDQTFSSKIFGSKQTTTTRPQRNSKEDKFKRFPGNLVFLSARPHVYRDVTESYSYKKFKRYFKQGLLHTEATLLPGSMIEGTKYMWSGNSEPLARQKFLSFKEYISLYPEFKMVFVGDNGQGDFKAGRQMLEEFGDQMDAIFIHVVKMPLLETHGIDSEFLQSELCEAKVVFYKNYVDAGIQAYFREIISLDGLEEICFETVEKWNYHIKTKYTKWIQKLRSLRMLNELNDSLEEGREIILNEKYHSLLQKKFGSRFQSFRGQIEEIRLEDDEEETFLQFSNYLEQQLWIYHSIIFPVGCVVICPFGFGIVIGFRSRDGMYEVKVPVSYQKTISMFVLYPSLSLPPPLSFTSSVGSTTSFSLFSSSTLSTTKSNPIPTAPRKRTDSSSSISSSNATTPKLLPTSSSTKSPLKSTDEVEGKRQDKESSQTFTTSAFTSFLPSLIPLTSSYSQVSKDQQQEKEDEDDVFEGSEMNARYYAESESTEGEFEDEESDDYDEQSDKCIPPPLNLPPRMAPTISSSTSSSSSSPWTFGPSPHTTPQSSSSRSSKTPSSATFTLTSHNLRQWDKRDSSSRKDRRRGGNIQQSRSDSKITTSSPMGRMKHKRVNSTNTRRSSKSTTSTTASSNTKLRRGPSSSISTPSMSTPITPSPPRSCSLSSLQVGTPIYSLLGWGEVCGIEEDGQLIIPKSQLKYPTSYKNKGVKIVVELDWGGVVYIPIFNFISSHQQATISHHSLGSKIKMGCGLPFLLPLPTHMSLPKPNQEEEDEVTKDENEEEDEKKEERLFTPPPIQEDEEEEEEKGDEIVVEIDDNDHQEEEREESSSDSYVMIG